MAFYNDLCKKRRRKITYNKICIKIYQLKKKETDPNNVEANLRVGG